METTALNDIVEQLSRLETINVARTRKFDANGEIIESTEPTSDEKKHKLLDILTHDPALFLGMFNVSWRDIHNVCTLLFLGYVNKKLIDDD